ncbi:MAG TPA: NUDIX domain-containing protein [Candidatus Binatia bacterium]|nr:NUDIX domain-containing protein [Candidatus Binatia bacterium]
MAKSVPVQSLDKRHKLIVAVYVILRKPDGKVLLLKRANTGYRDGYYGLPAGHLESGESIILGAARETKEEVGVNLEPHNLKLVHVMHYISSVPMPHDRLGFYFEATKWQDEPVNAEPHKCHELKWVSPKALPANMVPEVNQALQMIARGELYSDLGFS